MSLTEKIKSQEEIAKVLFEKCSKFGIEEAFAGVSWEDLPDEHASRYFQIAYGLEQSNAAHEPTAANKHGDTDGKRS